MKTFLIWFTSITAAVWVAYADSEHDANLHTSQLNKGLKGLFHDVASGVAESNIVGRPIDVYLNLRLCSEKHLFFNDTQIVLDGKTTYQFITWQYDQADVEKVKGQKNITCHVKGHVIEVRRGATTPGMPYVVAQLEQIALVNAEPMPLKEREDNQ